MSLIDHKLCQQISLYKSSQLDNLKYLRVVKILNKDSIIILIEKRFLNKYIKLLK
jgi:hypothetical protein